MFIDDYSYFLDAMLNDLDKDSLDSNKVACHLDEMVQNALDFIVAYSSVGESEVEYMDKMDKEMLSRFNLLFSAASEIVKAAFEEDDLQEYGINKEDLEGMRN